MIYDIDVAIINFLRKIAIPVSRFAIFVIFFWFGLLKVIGFSPAEGLVENLLQTTMPFIEPATFMIYFGLFEMLIGVMFIVKGLEREVIPLLALHMFTTFMPLFLLPSIMWTQAFVPTLEGQYIIKNLVIIATAIGIAAHLRPMKQRIN